MTTFSKLGKGNFLKLIMNIYKKPAANIIFNGKKPDAFPLRSEQTKDISVPIIILEILANEIRQEKEIKLYADWEERNKTSRCDGSEKSKQNVKKTGINKQLQQDYKIQG